MERGEQNEKRINRDYTRELQNIQTQSDKEKHLMTMALIGAKKLAEKYPDEPCHFDVALTVIRGLHENNVVFGWMGVE